MMEPAFSFLRLKDRFKKAQGVQTMKKRFLGMILTIALLLTCLAPAGALAETVSATMKMPNAGGSLHLRSKASKTSASLGYVQDGDSLQVDLGVAARDNEDELWVKVKVSRTGKTGYIKSKYISRAFGPSVYVNPEGGSLKVRSGPGTSYSVAGYVQHGKSISVLSRGDVWSKVRVTATGVTGYIKTKYVFGATAGVVVGSSSSGSSPSSGSSSSTSTAWPSSYDAATVMTRTAFGTVNVRSGAGTGYSSVAKVSRGDKLAVTGKSGDWYKVQLANGKTGYISASYVSFGVSASTTANVNFRKGAGTGYGIIRSLSKGTSVVVHSVSGSWANVTAGGTRGYVSVNYLKF